MSTDPIKQAEADALAKLNADKSWLSSNRTWLIAVIVAFLLGVLTRCVHL